MSRKRGGQPGNINALKHGFYSSHFTEAEAEDIAAVSPGLQDEISLLRVIIRRLSDIFLTDPDLSPSEQLTYLDLLSKALNRLSVLMRVNDLLSGSEDSKILSSIKEAVFDFSKRITED
jgi:hypothetical protein